MHFINLLHHWDQAVTLFINELHNPATDSMWMFFSDKLVWAPLYAIVIFFLFKRLGWRNGLIAILAAVLTFIACDQTSNLLKYSVARLRPCYSETMITGGLNILESRGNYFGFFSAHAANAFGFALCTSICLKWNTAHTCNAYVKGILIWAALVSISRIFVGKHYLGDITTGALIGSFYGAAFALTARWLFSKELFSKRRNHILHSGTPGALDKNGVSSDVR